MCRLPKCLDEAREGFLEPRRSQAGLALSDRPDASSSSWNLQLPCVTSLCEEHGAKHFICTRVSFRHLQGPQMAAAGAIVNPAVQRRKLRLEIRQPPHLGVERTRCRGGGGDLPLVSGFGPSSPEFNRYPTRFDGR